MLQGRAEGFAGVGVPEPRTGQGVRSCVATLCLLHGAADGAKSRAAADLVRWAALGCMISALSPFYAKLARSLMRLQKRECYDS